MIPWKKKLDDLSKPKYFRKYYTEVGKVL